MPRKSHDGQYYFLGRWFPWLPCANDIYSNYWSYYFRSQTKVQKYFLTTHSVFQSQASGESSNEDTECVTGQLLLVSLYSGVRGPDVKCKLWKNRDLMGSPDRGCGLTMDSLHDTELCSAPTPTAKCKDWGPEDCNPLSLPRIPVGKDVHVDLSKLG